MNKNEENKDKQQLSEQKKSWLKKESTYGKEDYSMVDYSKYFKLINPIHDSIILINKKFPLVKKFPQKYKSDELIPEEINIKILAKKYTNNLPLIEKYTLETIKNLKPTKLNLSLTFFLHELEKNKNNNYLKQIDESLSDLMGELFQKLRPRVRLHENLFFYVLTQLEKEVLNDKIVDYDMNILYWVTLYHDI